MPKRKVEQEEETTTKKTKTSKVEPETKGKKTSKAAKEVETKGKKSTKEVTPAKLDEETFLKHAKALTVTIGDQNFKTVNSVPPKSFKTGSFGWGLSGQVIKVKVGNEELTVQLSLNMPVRGSKPKKEESD